MRVLVLLALAVVAVAARPGDDEFTDGSAASFGAWSARYRKRYATAAVRDAAFANFQATARRVTLKNLAQSRVGYKVGKFADLSPAEFRARYLNLDGRALRTAMQRAPPLAVAAPRPLAGPLPADFDWARQTPSPVTYVKDQGQCGSCWTFSVTETLESAVFLAGKFPNGNQLTDLSEQQIVDCDKGNATWPDDGCNGGFTQGAFEYVMGAGGLESEADYPYLSGDDGGWGPCTADPAKVVPGTRVRGWQYAVPTCTDACTNQNATLLMQQLVGVGPLSVCVVATDDWQDYSWGVLTGDCPSDAADINHGVQLTGYANAKNEGWWVVRNSWGDDWGNDGYIWLQTPNQCGVADIVTFPLL